MKGYAIRSFAFAALLIVGAGCAPVRSEKPSAAPVPAPVAQQVPSAMDAYEGWGEVRPGGVVSLRIPPGCKGDPGAGNIYVVCPTPGNDSPTPDMRLSSDGSQVNIRRWENQEWDQWDKVIASLRVLSPLGREVQINIEK